MSTHYDVIIVGAGLAGLTSAYELSNQGLKVLILEAQSQAGGRVKTLRKEFSHHLYADAGAHFIPGEHTSVLAYTRKFKLPIVSMPDKGIFYYLMGMNKSIGIKPGEPWPSGIPTLLSEGEKQSGLSGIIGQFVAPALEELGDPTATHWPHTSLKKYDDISFLQFLKTRPTPPSDGAIDLLRPFLWWGSRQDLDSVSALSLLRQLKVGLWGNQVNVMRGGMDLLPKAFENRLIGKISYKSEVVSIRQRTRSVAITYRCSGKKHSLSAERVICAIPFSTLRDLSIEPRLDSRKHGAIENLSCKSVARFFLQCKRRVWEINSATFTDLPTHNLLEPTLIQRGTHKILECYISGEQAKTILQLDARDRIPFVLGQAQVIHPDIVSTFEQGSYICWDEDRWSRGAYAFFKPGEMFKFPQDLLISPEGRIHFAGDQTSAHPGWMEGAIESGYRAAKQVIEASKS